MASPAAVLNIMVTANTRGAQTGLLRLNQRLGATATTAQTVQSRLATVGKVGAFGVAAGLGFAVKKAADFEAQMDSLGSVTSANGRTMKQFEKQAKEAGAATKFSALDAAQAQTELAKGGMSVRNIMRGGLKSALALAAAGEMELAEAASTTANAMNLFALNGSKSMKVADGLAMAANRTTADVSDFAMALRMGGSVAKMAGLSFTETVVALEALAKIGVKNSDAGTSLKTAFLQLLSPTQKQADLAKKLNLEFTNQEGKMKSMAQISDMLRDRLGDMTMAQRTATLATLAGTDGVRTLSALYNAGGGKIRKWKDELEKSGTAADVARRKQSNLKGALENLRGSVETIAISVGQKLLPELTKFARSVTKILNAENLTGSEKFGRIMDLIAQMIAAAAPKVAEAGLKLAGALASGFAQGWREMNPIMKILSAAAMIRLIGGPGALMKVGAAMGALLGKGLSAGMATSVAGGAAAGAGGAAAGGGLLGSLRSKILPVAKRAGLVGVGIALADSVISEFGRRAAEKSPDLFTALKAKKGNMFAGDVLSVGGLFRKDSEKAARRLSDALTDISEKQKAIGWNRAKELRQELGRLDGVSAGARAEFNKLINGAVNKSKDLRQVRNEFGRMRSGSILSVKEMRTVTSNNFERIRETMGVNSKKGKEAVETNFRLSLRTIKDFKERGVLNTKEGMREVARLVRVHSGSSKESMKKNMSAVRQFVGVSMKYAANATGAGMKIVRNMFRKELALYGLSKEAIKFRVEGKEQSGKNIPSPGEVSFVNKQRGGPINMGKLSGDSVPAMLERGEYVLNRKAVKKMGRANLDAMNFANAPRFQQGGMVRIPGDPDRTGGRDKVNSSVRDLAAFLVRLGNMEIGYAYDPGGGHESPGHNVTGTALDAVPAGADPGWTKLERAIRWATNRGMTVYYDGQAGSTPLSNHGEGNHAHFELATGNPGNKFPNIGVGGNIGQIGKVSVKGGENGVLNPLMQKGLDRVRAAANERLQSLAQKSGAAGMDPQGMPSKFTGAWKDLMYQLGRKRGWNMGDWEELIRLESGGDPTATNPSSGAYGIGQFLGATKDAYAKYGATSPDPSRQIYAMYRYIIDRYGTPSKALAWHHGHNWYSQGGLVEGFQEGGMVGGAARAGRDIVRSYPLARKGSNIGGPSAHKARAWGNWQSDNAVDVGVSRGTKVKAVVDGTIGRVGGSWRGGSGNPDGYGVYLDPQGGGPQWWYTHLMREGVRQGQKVNAGQNIGISGAANGVDHIHLARNSGDPQQALGWPIMSGADRRGGGGGGGGKGKGSGKPEPKKGVVKGGNIGYVGDSLGVRTKPLLDKMLKKFKLVGKVKGAMDSGWGINQLKDIKDKKLKQLVFDFGSNDASVGGLIANMRRADAMTGSIPMHVFTLNPGLGGGDGSVPKVAAKNKAINKLGGDIRVIPWGEKTGNRLHGGYGKRASMAARSIKTLARQQAGRGQDPSSVLPPQLQRGLTKAPIGKAFGTLMKAIRRPSKKARNAAVKLFLKRIRKMPEGIPSALQKTIEALTTNATLFGERGDRASQLNEELTDAEGNPLLDADKRPMTRFGVVGGLNEAQWVQKQLSTLFSLRNKLAQGRQVVNERREKVAGLIARATKTLTNTKDQIKAAAKQKGRLDKALGRIKKLSGRGAVGKARKIVRDLKAHLPKGMWDRLWDAVSAKKNPLDKVKGRLKNQIGNIEDAQKGRVRARGALSKQIIPGLRTKHGAFGERFEELVSSLSEVQGTGGPMGQLKILPPLGELGGSLFDAQMRLRELSVKPDRVIDSTSSDAGTDTDDPTKELLQQLLREANLRTAVSQAQYKVFQDLPKFHTGGIVGGRVGSESMAVVQGGEGVFTRDQMAAMGSPNVNISFSGNLRWLEDLIDVRVENSTRQQARRGSRGLPGRGGGLISG